MLSINAKPITEKQWASLRRVCEHQNIDPPSTFDYYIDEKNANVIGVQANGMFIGIETDGHAHT
jgi:hypothetical protein